MSVLCLGCDGSCWERSGLADESCRTDGRFDLMKWRARLDALREQGINVLCGGRGEPSR